MDSTILKQMPLWKKIIFALIPLVLILTAVEVGGRAYYYQRTSGYPLAIVQAFDVVSRKITEFRARAIIEEIGEPQDPHYYANFYNATNMTDVREECFGRYEVAFEALVTLCQKSDAVLIVLYIPSSEDSRDISRSFFQQLTTKYNTPYLDTTYTFSEYSPTVTNLYPRNAHLARFGNQLISDDLISFIQPYLSHRSAVSYRDRPGLLGDLRPNYNSIWTIDPEMPYRVITNSQGLRMKTDVAFPKSDEKTRVLFIGDSFTFGPYLDNHDCYPQLIEQKEARIEAINAGIAGYTICDEYSYFEDRGRYIEPDIVVLQVLDNDLYGLLPHKQKAFCRGGQFCIYPEQRRP